MKSSGTFLHSCAAVLIFGCLEGQEKSSLDMGPFETAKNSRRKKHDVNMVGGGGKHLTVGNKAFTLDIVLWKTCMSRVKVYFVFLEKRDKADDQPCA